MLADGRLTLPMSVEEELPQSVWAFTLFCTSLFPRLCGSYSLSYNLTFVSSQNVMLVMLITNSEGRNPGFRAEFFQMPKMRGKERIQQPGSFLAAKGQWWRERTRIWGRGI